MPRPSLAGANRCERAWHAGESPHPAVAYHTTDVVENDIGVGGWDKILLLALCAPSSCQTAVACMWLLSACVEPFFLCHTQVGAVLIINLV